MFSSKKITRIVLYVIFGLAVFSVFCLLADIYRDKSSRDIMFFLCTFIACIVSAVSLLIAKESNDERKRLIQAIEKATAEIQNLSNTIAKHGKTNAEQK